MHKKISVILSCIDYRFWPKASRLLKKEYGDFDLIEMAGASKNIASPNHKDDRHAVLESIKTSIKLHNARFLILTNHIDCGAYGGSESFASYKEEADFHKKELDKAKRIVRKIFPELKIKAFLLTRDAKGKIKII